MLVHLIGMLGLAWVAILSGNDIAFAEKPPPSDPSSTKSMMDQLQQEYKDTVGKWKESGQGELPSLKSPFAKPGDLTIELPPECIEHLKEERLKLEQGSYSQDAWMHHIFDCEMCCAPLLADIMDIHVKHVIANPHVVVLFDFDKYDIRERYQVQLDALLQKFDPSTDELLLIGRASHIGDRAYNIILSGQRAGEIKDYAMEKFALADEKIHYLFFGYDPPQLTPALAARYGVKDEDIAVIDADMNLSPEYKVNQSVVVIVNKAEGEVVKPESPAQAPNPPVAQTPAGPDQAGTEQAGTEQAALASPDVSGQAKAEPPPAAAPEAPAVAPSGPDSERSDEAVASQPTAVVMVTDMPTSNFYIFGQEFAFLAEKAGFDVKMSESDDSLDTIRRLLTSETPALGIVSSDAMGYLNQVPDHGIDHIEALRLLFPIYDETIHLFARQEVKQVKDLGGKRVIMGLKGSRSWITAHHMLHVFEVEPAETIDNLPPAEAIAAVLKGQADALFYVAEKPAKLFERIRDLQANPQYAPLVQTVHLVLLKMTDDQHGYVASDIGPEDYAWIKTKIPTLAVQVVLASAHFDGESVPDQCQKLTTLGQVIHDNLPNLQSKGHPKWQEVDLQQSLPSWKHTACLQSAQNVPAQENSSAVKRQ